VSPIEHAIQTLTRELRTRLDPQLSLELAWPSRRNMPPRADHASARGCVIELGLGPDPTASTPSLWLDAGVAGALIDRALGGPGHPGLATLAAAPSDAELGVLAYLAARCAKALPPLWVHDVRTGPPACDDGAYILPCTVSFSQGRGVAQLTLPPHLAAPASNLLLRVGVADVLDAEDLACLEPGDLLQGPSLQLLVTSAGLCGPCALQVPGLGIFEGLLDGTRARLRSSVRLSSPSTFVELTRRSVSLTELCDLGASGSIDVPPIEAPLRLFREGQEHAACRLVRRGGELALRIEALTPSSSETR
jgi:hypothetical protein